MDNPLPHRFRGVGVGKMPLHTVFPGLSAASNLGNIKKCNPLLNAALSGQGKTYFPEIG